MKGFKKCNNGHYFKDHLDGCPYCPQSGGLNSGNGSDATKVEGGGTTEFEKTQMFGGGNPTAKKQEGNVNLERTFISGVTNLKEGETGKKEPRATRMLVGWLVSYTIDEMGIDFRLYEGRNTVGKKPENAITVPNDPSVSGHHLTILYRRGKYLVEDALSSNGTFVNGQELEPRSVYELFDGDEVRAANTVFKFKKSL